MKIGFRLPQWGVAASREGIIEVARTIEEAGFDSAWVGDHVVHPACTQSAYPYSTGGEVLLNPEDGFFEAFQVLSFAAAVTEHITLGTSVAVLPLRHPLLVAKATATLDVLSGGRVVLGVGSGWWAEEFLALGVPFDHRGDRMDEQLAIIGAAWRDGSVAWEGNHYRFDRVFCEPRPLQASGPPIWIGGQGPRTWRRIAKFGDGWHGVGHRPGPIGDAQSLIHRAAAEIGREPAGISMTTSTALPTNDEAAIERLLGLASAGISHVVLPAGGHQATDACDKIRHLAAEVLPEVRRHAPS